MCCAVQRSSGFDVCQKNGLCSNTLIGEDEFWRESCTDRSWFSESCLKLCIDGVGVCFSVPPSPLYSLRIALEIRSILIQWIAVATDSDGIAMNATDRIVNQCPNGSFCCKDLNSTCCDDSDGLWIDTSDYQLRNYDPTKTTSSSSASGSSSSSSTGTSASLSPAIGAASTTPASPATTTSQSPKKPSHTSSGAVAGGVVGGVIALAAFLGLGGYLYRKRRRSSSRKRNEDVDNDGRRDEPFAPINGSYKAEKDGTELVEMDGNELRARNVELDAGQPLVAGDENGKAERRSREDFPIPVNSSKMEYKTHIAENLALANSND